MKTLISYPRSGAHWLMTLADLGLKKKIDWQHLHDIRFYNWWEMPEFVSRVDTLEDGTFKPHFTVGDLDRDGFKPLIAHSTLEIARKKDHSFEIDELVFLYRKDLPSVVYSRLKLFGCPITKENILRIIITYDTYLDEWKKFISDYDKPTLVISYEDLHQDTYGTLENVLEFYGFDNNLIKGFDPKSVGKAEVAEYVNLTHFNGIRQGKYSFPLVRYDQEYLEQREAFMDEFEDHINLLYKNKHMLPSIEAVRSTKPIKHPRKNRYEIRS